MEPEPSPPPPIIVEEFGPSAGERSLGRLRLVRRDEPQGCSQLRDAMILTAKLLFRSLFSHFNNERFRLIQQLSTVFFRMVITTPRPPPTQWNLMLNFRAKKK